MKIFFICQRVPFPPNRGDKITTFNELRHLSRHHEVHVYCLADGNDDLANVAGAREYATTVTAIPVASHRAQLRAVGALLIGGALSVAMLREPALRAAIAAGYAELKPDLIFVFSSNMAQYAESFRQLPRIVQMQELDSLKFQQYAATRRAPIRWIYAREHARLLTYERHVATTFSHSLVCTKLELQEFQQMIPGCPVSVVGNGVDLAFFRTGNIEKVRGEIIFTGVMDYIPNVDAVTWFCDAILPLVRLRVPHAHFTICGIRPAASVLRLADRPGVTVTGKVEDIRPFLDRAEVSVAPLRIARGIQNKILEALAMSVPVVASVAVWTATGIAAGDGILPADTAEAFANHIIRLLQDDAVRAEMSRRGREAVARDFTWDRQLAELDKVLTAAAANHPG